MLLALVPLAVIIKRVTRPLTITPMASMTANPDPRTNSMRQGTLAPVVDACCKITQSHAPSDPRNALFIDDSGLESFETNYHATVLAARAI